MKRLNIFFTIILILSMLTPLGVLAQDIEVTPEMTAEPLPDTTDSSDTVDPVGGDEFDRLLESLDGYIDLIDNQAERRDAIIQDIVKAIALVFVGGYVIIVLLQSAYNAYTMRKISAFTDGLLSLSNNPTLTPKLEDFYNESSDPVKLGVDGLGDSIELIKRFLNGVAPDSTVAINVGALDKLLDEVRDRIPYMSKIDNGDTRPLD